MNHIRAYKGQQPNIGNHVYIDLSAVVIGVVELADDVSIWPYVVIRGDVNYIQIGKRTNIQDGSVLHVARPTPNNPQGYPLIIGDDVTIGHKAMLHGCVIDHHVLIGMGAILLDGVKIEDYVMVGAGALVPPGKVLTSGYLYHGNPARQIRALTSSEREMLERSSEHYVRLKNEYINEMCSD